MLVMVMKIRGGGGDTGADRISRKRDDGDSGGVMVMLDSDSDV